MKIRFILFIIITIICQGIVLSCSTSEHIIDEKSGPYQNISSHTKESNNINPIIRISCPDPSIIKAPNNIYYLYGTEDIRNIPIFKSKDLINWEYVGTAFTDETRPKFLNNSIIWAPDINYINGKFVMYYALSSWGEEWKNGIGVAISEKPEGPFTDKGKLFTSEEIEVQNSIDPFYIEDNGTKYLFWGSLHMIYGIELSEDGLSIKEGAVKCKIPSTGGIEATYIHKQNNYYYLFGSTGSCCYGNSSTYHIVYGRSTNLFGPYMSIDGTQPAISPILQGNNYVAGPGHNAEIITDDNGQDWILYHGFLRSDPDLGRVVFIDKINWENDWPVIPKSAPSENPEYPFFNK